MKFTARLLAVTALLPLLIACSDRKPARPRVAYVTNCVASFWSIAEAGARAAAKKFDVDCDVRMPSQNDAAKQKQILEEVLDAGVDGIAVSPVDPDNQTGFLDELARSTILITHDSDAPHSHRRCFVGIDNYEAGRMCGDLVREAMPGGGSLMLFVGNLGTTPARAARASSTPCSAGSPSPNATTRPAPC